MAIPWLRPQDKRSLQLLDKQTPQEQFPANDSYYGDRRELGVYGGSPQNMEAQTAQSVAPTNFGAGPSQFGQDQMRRLEVGRGPQPGASWGTASPVQPSQQPGGPSQFAQDQTQGFRANVSRGGGLGASAATAQPIQQGNYGPAAQLVPQNRVNPMIENSRTALMNYPAPRPAQAQTAPQVQSSGATVQAYGGQQQRSVQNTASPVQPGQRPAQSRWGRPRQQQAGWGQGKPQSMSQANTAAPSTQPARRDAAAYGQPKRWGA